MSYPFKNLVFEGGGVKGLAYVGALEVLEARDVLTGIVRVGGASAGAITALLLSVGYEVHEVKSILEGMDFEEFKDGGLFPLLATRLLCKFGLYKGDRFKEWIGELIHMKTGLKNPTFAQFEAYRKTSSLKTRSIYILGTNLSTRFSEVFSHETTPGMSIIEAVRISMSIPLFFAAVKDHADYYVDGGVLNNYPIQLFDDIKYRIGSGTHASSSDGYKNPQTLGFRLDSKEEIGVFRDQKAPRHDKINSLKDYIAALAGTLMALQDNRHLEEEDWNRTVYINTIGVHTTDFNLSPERKQKLIESGCAGALRYFEWWDSANQKTSGRKE